MSTKKAGLLKKCREEKKIKQEVLARQLHVSKSLLSNIETGISQLNPDMEEALAKLLDWSVLDEQEIARFRNQFKDLFQALYYGGCDPQPLLEKLTSSTERLEHSELFISFWLILYLYHVFRKEEVQPYDRLLRRYQRCMNPEELRFFQLFQVIQLKNENAYDLALEGFRKLLKESLQPGCYTALLMYHASMAYFLKGDLINAYRCNAESQAQFLKEANTRRYCYALSHEANILRLGRLNEQADRLYQKLIFMAEDQLNDQNFNSILCNASYNRIAAEDYEGSRRYLELRRGVWQTIPQLYFNLAWTAYKLDSKEVFLTFLDEIEGQTEDRYIADTLKILRFLACDPENEALIQLLDECAAYLEAEGDLDTRLFIDQQRFDYYQRTGNKTRQVQLLQQILKLKSQSLPH